MTSPEPTSLEEANDTIAELTQTVDKLQGQVAWLTRQLFGRKSEQLKLNEGEGLFDHLPDPPAAEGEGEDETPETETISYERRRRGKRKPLPEDLPREERIHDLPEDEKVGMRKINEETCEQLEIVPGRLYVVKHIQYVYAREQECLDGSEPNVVTAPRPVEGLPRCIAGPGLLAYVMTSKFADHLPYYRIGKILKRNNVDQVSRATMGRWPVPLDEMCRPLMGLMKEVLLQSHVIEADETTVRQQREGKGPTTECYFYSYVGDEAHPLTIYDYRQTRTRAGPNDWFTDAHGEPLYHDYLQCDGHSTYDHLFDSRKPWGMTRVGCWAHARRKFHDARIEASGPCHHALGQIRRLYEVEKRARPLDPDERRELREEFSRPIVDGFFKWCNEQQSAALPASGLGKALTYALNQQATLERYLEDGRLQIDNNACERSMRPIAIGRKNWLFTGSPRAGEAAATMFSLIASADRHGHDPLAYLTDVFRRLPATPVSEVGQFLPHVWEPPAAE